MSYESNCSRFNEHQMKELNFEYEPGNGKYRLTHVSFPTHSSSSNYSPLNQLAPIGRLPIIIRMGREICTCMCQHYNAAADATSKIMTSLLHKILAKLLKNASAHATSSLPGRRRRRRHHSFCGYSAFRR